MAWIEGISSFNTILRDLATYLTMSNYVPNAPAKTEDYLSPDNWKLVYPRPYTPLWAYNIALTPDATNTVFTSSIKNWYPWVTPTIFVGGIAADPSTYTIDFENGVVTFNDPQEAAVTATFQYEGNRDLAGALQAITDRVVLKTTIQSVAQNTDSPFTTDPFAQVTSLTMYVEFIRPQYLENPENAVDLQMTTIPNFHYIKVRMFDSWDDINQKPYGRTIDAVTGMVLDNGANISDWSKWAWRRDWQEVLTAEINGSLNVDDITQGVSFVPRNTPGLNGNIPIHVYGSVNSQRAALVLQGDPTLDYDGYLISFGYLGKIDSFTYTTIDPITSTPIVHYYSNDTAGNFAITVGSSTMPAMSIDGNPAVIRDAVMNTIVDATFSKSWGTNTANGVTDISMYKTRSGVPYQKHQIAFETSEEYTEHEGYSPSRWTNRYHLSLVKVEHGYDGKRGFLKDVVACDPASLMHLDDLEIINPDGSKDYYKYFAINAPYSVFENSANWHYGIAIKKI
jgi:hypothetical protein